MQQTSLEAYFSEVQPQLSAKQDRVLTALKACKIACNQELAEYLNMPINSITPRIFELRAKGIVEQDRKDTYPKTNRTVIYWRVK